MRRALSPTPTGPGFYWATLRANGLRMVVWYRADGFNRLRVFAPWFSRSFGVEEFERFKGPLRERS